MGGLGGSTIRHSLGAGLGTGGLRRLQAGWMASALGSWTFFVALAVYAYEAHGTAGVGLAAVARMVPAGVAAPLAGLLVDRLRRRGILLASLAVRAVLAAGLAAGAATGAPFGLMLADAALLTVVMTAHKPAQAGMLLELVEDPTQLGAANALWTGVDNAAFLLGSLLGGALIAAANVQAAFAATAGLYALAIVPTAAITGDEVAAHRAGPGRGRRAPAAALAGFRQVFAERDVRGIVGFLGLATVLEGAVDVLVVVLAIRVFDLGAAGVGWLNTAWGFGGLAGAGVALGLLGRGRLSAGIAAGGLLVGAPLAVAGLTGSAPVAFVMFAALGIGYALIEAAGLSLLQRLNADDVVGRAFAVVEANYWLATGVGAVLAPALVSWLGIRGAVVAAGAFLPLVVLLRWRGLARYERQAVVPERPFVTLRRLPVFAPLPMVAVENLARRVRQLEVASGEVIVRRGEPGEQFYVVADGAFDVSDCDGRPPPLGSGDSFGEIALLHPVPRTATVTARTAGLLYALDRDAFLTAISRHPRSADAAAEIAATRLGRAKLTPEMGEVEAST